MLTAEAVKKAVEDSAAPLFQRIGLLEQQNKAVEKALADKTSPIETRIAAVETAMKERQAPTVPGLSEEIAKRKRETGVGFSLVNLAKAQITRRESEAKFEIDVCKEFGKLTQYEGIQKDLSTDVNTAGGFLVPTQAIPEMIELLRAKEVLQQLGATRISGLKSSPVQIPKQTGGATGVWLGENASITKSQQTFGQVSGQTRKLAGLTVLSRELIMQSVPSVDGIVRDDLARVLGLARDLAGIKGSGSSNQPLGIMNTTGVNTSTLASVTMDKLMDFVATVETDNADMGSLGWIFKSSDWNIVRKLKDAENRYYLRPDVSVGEKRSLLGAQVALSNQLTAGEVVYGNFKDLVFLEWGGLEFRASEETSDAFQKDQVWIRAILLTDVIVRHAESFCVVTDLS